MLVGINTLDDKTLPFEWSLSGSFVDSGSGGDKNITDLNFPTRRVNDRQPHAGSQPAAQSVDSTLLSNAGAVSLLFDLKKGTDDEHTFDVWSLTLTNEIPEPVLSTDIASLSITLIVADDNAFGTNVVFIKTVQNVKGPTKIVELSLGLTSNDRRWNDVQFAKIQIEARDQTGATADFADYKPNIGQVLLGRRRQMGHQPKIPFDDQPQESNTVDFISDSGVRVSHVLASGFARISTAWAPTESGASNIDEVDTLRKWFKDIGFGTKHFMWIHPLKSREHWMDLEGRVLNLPLQGPVERAAEFTMIEIPPFTTDEI